MTHLWADGRVGALRPSLRPSGCFAPPVQEDEIAPLERLGARKVRGMLTEEEFAAQTVQLLGG